MSFAPGSVVPSDTLVTPLQQQLCVVAQQIQGIDPNLCFASPPRGPLEEGSVLFPLRDWAVESQTNGRIRLTLTFHAYQVFRQRQMDEVIPVIQSYLPAWLQVLGAWSNQTLGGLAISFDFSGGTIEQLRHNSHDYLALRHVLSVLVQVNVSTHP